MRQHHAFAVWQFEGEYRDSLKLRGLNAQAFSAPAQEFLQIIFLPFNGVNRMHLVIFQQRKTGQHRVACQGQEAFSVFPEDIEQQFRIAPEMAPQVCAPESVRRRAARAFER